MMTSRQRPRPKGAKIPQRRCVMCRRRAGKGELARIVRRPEGGVQVEPSAGPIDSAQGRSGQAERPHPGRGAYVCPGCVEKAAPLLQRIEYALRVRLSGEERRALEAALERMAGDAPQRGRPL